MEFNSTIFIQVGIYLFTLIVLKKLYFEPLLQLLQRREKLTVGKVEDSSRMVSEIEVLKKEHAEKLLQFRKELLNEKELRLGEVRSQSAEELNAAKRKIESHASHQIVQLSQEYTSIKSKLDQVAQTVSQEIVAKILSSGAAGK